MRCKLLRFISIQRIAMILMLSLSDTASLIGDTELNALEIINKHIITNKNCVASDTARKLLLRKRSLYD